MGTRSSLLHMSSGESVFSSAMSNSLQWAMGYPVSDGHFALTFLLVMVGGAKLFQTMASTFNALRYGWGTCAPSWLIGCYAVQMGMAMALTSQPEFLVDSPRILISGFGALLAVLIVAAPITKYAMSVGYGAAVSCWLTTLAAALFIATVSSMIGGGVLTGTPKVLHWQGDVRVRDTENNPWKTISKDRKMLEEGGSIQALSGSGAIVNIAGYRILMLPGSQIRIAELGEEPRVTLQEGRIFSRGGPSANRKFRYDTKNAGLRVNGADLMLGFTPAGVTSVLVADGGLRVGRSVDSKDMVSVKKRYYVNVTANVSTPVRADNELLEDLKVLGRYSENPFAAANRAMISGRKVKKKEPKPAKPEPDTNTVPAAAAGAPPPEPAKPAGPPVDPAAPKP
ncbi:MAG: hypothetical protein ACI91J_000494 [Yoonia sp.]|jgi:hypothetical protein